ncbi:MAG: hypothetical protein H6712_33960 [Myxococcales bacterium]|nr:hypothetical protein [Myxococcales bacterium]
MIPPGGEGEIQVTLRPKGGHTEITKDIIVLSNDPEQPRFTLTMKGTLLVDMIAQPVTVGLHDLPPGEAGTETFSLRPTEGSTATIESVRVEDATLFSLREIEAEAGALATYELRFAGRKEVGVSATHIVVETTGANTPELVIPVRASVATNLRYPRQFGFSWRDGELLERTIGISTRRGDAPAIEEIEDPDGLLEIEVLEPRGPTTSIRMRVRADQRAKAEPGVRHTMIVHTNDPDEPRLELEYRVMEPRKVQPMQISGH